MKQITDNELSELSSIVDSVQNIIDIIKERGDIEPPAPLPVAEFSVDIVSGQAPLTVTFKNQSTNATSYLWSFGDGNTSTLIDTVHTYLEGVYTVGLTARNNTGASSNIKPNFITVISVPLGIAPKADFVGSPLIGPAPLMTDFVNLTTGTLPITYEWDFNNTGWIGSVEESPKAKLGYSALGFHSVALTAKNKYGTDKKVKVNYVEVLPPTVAIPVANFTATPVKGVIPLTVQFTDTSLNYPTSWKWSFGDGGNSNVKNPSHIYTAVGTYTITLEVANSAGSNTKTVSVYITVTPPITTKPTAQFTAKIISGNGVINE